LPEQLACLLRDYVRAHDGAAAEFEAEKRALTETFRNDRGAYTDAKDPIVGTSFGKPTGGHRRSDDFRRRPTPEPSDARDADVHETLLLRVLIGAFHEHPAGRSRHHRRHPL